MALDAEYFDSIYIEVVKKKYYEASKVQAVFADIREQAEALNAENEDLRLQLAEIRDRKVELGDALLSAQSIYQEIVERAKGQAAAITADAERRRAAILADARRQSEQLIARSRDQEEIAARRVEEAFNRMKQLHQASVEALNAQWQDFLCSLDPAAAPPAPEPAPEQEPGLPTAPAEDPAQPPEPKPSPEEAYPLPPDLEEKVGAIAEELFSMEKDGQ